MPSARFNSTIFDGGKPADVIREHGFRKTDEFIAVDRAIVLQTLIHADRYL